VQVDSYPLKAKHCRAWDKAATLPSAVTKNPDYTAASPKIYFSEGYYYLVWDMSQEVMDEKARDKGITGRFRLQAGERDLLILAQAEHDGESCHVVFATDPSASGKVEFEYTAGKMLEHGFIVKKDPMPPNRSKLVRFTPFSSACQNGLVRIVKSSFPNEATYEAYVSELESFTGERSRANRKDDWSDATASAFNYISKMKHIQDFVIPLGNKTQSLLTKKVNNVRF
jgi:phage terminase large subunit-like protein